MQNLFANDYKNNETKEAKLYINTIARDMTKEKEKKNLLTKINLFSDHFDHKESITCINAQKMINNLSDSLNGIVRQFNYFENYNNYVYKFGESIPLNLHRDEADVYSRSIIGINFTKKVYIVYHSIYWRFGAYKVKKEYYVKFHNLDIRDNHASDVDSDCKLIK